MKTIYLECNMGAAGDMLMSALYEICDQKNGFAQDEHRLCPLSYRAFSGIRRKLRYQRNPHESNGGRYRGRSLSMSRRDMPITRMQRVRMHPLPTKRPILRRTDTPHAHHLRRRLRGEIASLDLPAEVKDDALAIYRLLGEAEAKVHDTTLEQIHFHEVGTLDALADVVGCALLIRTIAPEQILASPLHVGNGFVKCAHGVLPVPAPATAELLRGIPFYTGSVTGELLTPTGAAILHYYVLRYLPMPTMTASEIGYGIGSKDFGIANCVRAFLGDTASYLAAEEEEPYPATIPFYRSPATSTI